ncbi:Ig-like domain-containing protein [Microbacterium sp. M3]|uniref:Ig-like domain-containing protein n=1 Tax=Microbacterium arthrosphaerae TaxID=792652 RepID=A0ABU4H2W9_9MICO|nr:MULTISPECIES: Ig-like domain-containing protein [Microbacterium]MDW4573683.1 Ig-like domain-containing protein [Microbacterium arthrosphaerae]MDW7607538.1 Ig-like domain-containing protein [Microbacterium sp. M3]
MTAGAFRTSVLLLLAAVLLVVGPLSPALSSASFTAQTSNTGNRIGAAADWTPPTVAVQQPAGTLRDTTTVTALASDAETGIRSVVLSFQAVGATTWTTLCTATASPYTCSWSTRSVADGAYDLRAVATDNAGYVTTSAPVRATVGNTVTVVLAEPGDVVRGSISLATTLQNAGTAAYAVSVEYAPAGSTNANSWKTACTSTVAPYTCSWNTASVANGFYDLRATATANGVTTLSNVVTELLVDNAAPTAVMTDPGSPLRGTVTLAATASDADSGVARVVIQLAPNGTSSWQDACILTAPPYSCRYSTTSLAAGAYVFRAVATDAAGNTAMSAATAARTVDNSVASVAMEDPGAFLGGTATLTATANATAGIASIAIQVAPNGTTSWTTVCTPTASPFSCAWNSRSVADGLYDFRAVLTDATGATTTSAVVSARRVDNRAVRGVDVQTANGGATAGRLEAGDTMTFTYSTQMSPASIATGWNGAATAVTLRLRDGNLLSLGAAGDTVDVLRSNAAVNLGSVNLRGDYIKNNKTSTFNATMTATTVTVNGLPVTVVQITVGTLASGGALRTAPTTAAAAMVWTPSASATDLGGIASSNAPVTETGTLDREY